MLRFPRSSSGRGVSRRDPPHRLLISEIGAAHKVGVRTTKIVQIQALGVDGFASSTVARRRLTYCRVFRA